MKKLITGLISVLLIIFLVSCVSQNDNVTRRNQVTQGEVAENVAKYSSDVNYDVLTEEPRKYLETLIQIEGRVAEMKDYETYLVRFEIQTESDASEYGIVEVDSNKLPEDVKEGDMVYVRGIYKGMIQDLRVENEEKLVPFVKAQEIEKMK